MSANLRIYFECCSSCIEKKGGAELPSTPPFTFQLFIYENLSARYHYQIKEDEGCEKANYTIVFIINNKLKQRMEVLYIRYFD